MKKSMYSLILSDDVVRAADELASERGISRSALINGVLAEHFSVMTREMHAAGIFDAVFALLEGTRFTPFREANSGILTIRTPLECKYHPTVRYDVKITESAGGTYGSLRVGLRTQNPSIIRDLGDFFNLIAETERKFKKSAEYKFDGARVVRKLSLPGEYSADEAARAINHFIVMMDEMMNNYFSGYYLTKQDFEADYAARAAAMPVLP